MLMPAALDLSPWIGKTELREDVIAPGPAMRLLAALDDTETPFAEHAHLPPLWHWLYFLPAVPGREVGSDGHAERVFVVGSGVPVRRTLGADGFQDVFQVLADDHPLVWRRLQGHFEHVRERIVLAVVVDDLDLTLRCSP